MNHVSAAANRRVKQGPKAPAARGVDLRNVDLPGVNLRGVDLRSVGLRGADLRDGRHQPSVRQCGVPPAVGQLEARRVVSSSGPCGAPRDFSAAGERSRGVS
jgi:hypothetical protein